MPPFAFTDQRSRTPAMQGGSLSQPPQPPNVLIVEDDQSIRRILRLVIESPAYRVSEAATARDAIKLAARERPLVAVVDVRLQGESGLEVVRAIRSDPTTANTRIIILSALTAPEDLQAGLAAGADVYLTKPFSPLQLLDTIDTAFHHRQ